MAEKMKPMFRCPWYETPVSLKARVNAPKDMQRLENGVVRFGDDWPGVFLRGDYAIAMSIHLRDLLSKLPEDDWAGAAMLEGLANTLESCNTNGLPLEQTT